MGDEPMEEDDSFHRPVPCSMPFNKPFASQVLGEDKDSDPDSDDSFETFAPTVSTQSTGGSSGSAASAAHSAESKSSLPQLATNHQPKPITGTQRATLRTTVSPIPFSQQATQRMGFPNAPTPVLRPVIPFQPKFQNSLMMTQNNRGIHNAVKTTKETTSSSSNAAPSSPNSLSRHRSANSGLRNANVHTPPIRTGSMLFVRKTPPSQEQRPGTPSGEIKMLRDQLDNEKQKNQKMKADFQKDTQKSLSNYKKELDERDAKIKKQEKEIEILKTANACRKAESPVITRSTNIAIPSIPQSVDVKKVYPRIPIDPGNMRKTPRRNMIHFPQPVSAFRHTTKSEDEDTFQLDVSFEPSATSTPKIPVLPRTGIRRPLVLDSELIEGGNGAPTPKRKPVFHLERRQRNREELDEELRKIWEEIDDGDGRLTKQFFNEKKQEELPNEDQMEMIVDGNNWIDGYLSKQLKNIDFRKTLEKSAGTTKARSKILQQAEQRPKPNVSCCCCRIDARMSTETEEEPSEKEWESMEKQRTDRQKQGAEELRAQKYSTLLQGISRRGVDEIEGSSRRKAEIEKEYKEEMMKVKKRSLVEIRAEKKEVWRTAMMDELREKGELEAVLESQEGGRNDDCMWTSDSDDEDWMFATPYDHDKNELCSDCAHRQRLMRRISKREREKRKLKTECLKEYGVEQREMLRNMSILTKSKMEAADNELNRHVDEMLASRMFDDEDEDEDIF